MAKIMIMFRLSLILTKRFEDASSETVMKVGVMDKSNAILRFFSSSGQK